MQLTQIATWIWVLAGLQCLFSIFCVMAVAQRQKEALALQERLREAEWRVQNGEERLERLRLKGILTPETRLPLSERRGEPMPQPVRAPVTAEEGARLMAALWDVLGLLEEGTDPLVVRARLLATLGGLEMPPKEERPC